MITVRVNFKLNFTNTTKFTVLVASRSGNEHGGVGRPVSCPDMENHVETVSSYEKTTKNGRVTAVKYSTTERREHRKFQVTANVEHRKNDSYQDFHVMNFTLKKDSRSVSTSFLCDFTFTNPIVWKDLAFRFELYGHKTDNHFADFGIVYAKGSLFHV